MSLINEFLQDCILMDKKRTSDGEGVTATYTITTDKTVKLGYHDVLKTKDGKIFRVTSNAGEKETPASSNLNIAQVMAEKWELTS